MRDYELSRSLTALGGRGSVPAAAVQPCRTTMIRIILDRSGKRERGSFVRFPPCTYDRRRISRSRLGEGREFSDRLTSAASAGAVFSGSGSAWHTSAPSPFSPVLSHPRGGWVDCKSCSRSRPGARRATYPNGITPSIASIARIGSTFLLTPPRDPDTLGEQRCLRFRM